MTSRSLVWAITGMVRNQGLLLSNIEVISSAASPHLIDLTFVANDDDPLATDSFVETVERFGARVVKLPPGRNASWNLLTRQAGQLEYAWKHGGLSEMGASALIRSRTDLWMRRDYVTWICQRATGFTPAAKSVIVRGVHPTLPGYAEDLVLATQSDSLDLIFGVYPDMVPPPWRSHPGLMAHLARFIQLFNNGDVLQLYGEALQEVVEMIRSGPWGKLKLKTVTSTLPGGFWMLHQAALGQLLESNQLVGFLRQMQEVGQKHFVLPPDTIAPGHGLDRGSYGRAWSPVDVCALVTATSTDFVGSQEEVRLWRQALFDGSMGLEQCRGGASHFALPRQRLDHAAFLGAERMTRRALDQVSHKSRGLGRRLRKSLPPS